jgi:hypothetical protein
MSQILTTTSVAAKTARPKAVKVPLPKKHHYPMPKVPVGQPDAQKASPAATKVGVWELQSNEFTEFEPPEHTEALFNGPPNDNESVIGSDGRKVVPKKQLMPGGKYRGTWTSIAFVCDLTYVM